ncbi:TetR/AcrR family transcriptional regulator [Burkholderia ubonensis]|uniref:TetR family transcriptional regulator n=1 Tax=Burkholderia ubonensis TaxID=101571 RepID=A0A107FNE8_9BURK|nr:TetR/AcrR family transcriptional regulator [Burkholderia ubonensis]KWD71962.1 TetR family transcriptional regulator [Burkholderia ubonensis]KWD84635.1 TetR family transcriptional regulator [Burkholderia ubonensis]KWD94083.1 TetR family transcriptional regulator [Burkholderia ubonensis]KWD96710.1 TetR family transcriptional regulator [Burkholderia ubonensis]
MTNAVSTTPPRVRRSQHERSASARFALISATLDCLMEIGIAQTSITEICKRAGLSRGALLHHFPHKNELLVASYMAWLEGKLVTLEARLQPAASVRDEVAAWRAQMKETFSMTQEFYWALRNDRDLRERFNAALLTHPVGDDASNHLPRTRIDASHSPELTRYVIACFIRGLCFQELFVRDQATPDRAFEHFVDMLGAFLDQPGADPA